MRQTLSRGMVAAAAATSVLSLCGSPAFADSDTFRSSDSGSSAQELPDGASSAAGTPTEHPYGHDADYGNDGTGSGGSGARGDSGGSSAEAVTEGSPGVGSGNTVQVPVDVPVNVCGNTVDVVGILNPAFGNDCATGPGETAPPTTPPSTPPAVTSPSTPPAEAPPLPTPAGGQKPPALAETGSGALLGASAASAALILGGALLYRRSRTV